MGIDDNTPTKHTNINFASDLWFNKLGFANDRTNAVEIITNAVTDEYLSQIAELKSQLKLCLELGKVRELLIADLLRRQPEKDEDVV